jgi:hypothetical protein
MKTKRLRFLSLALCLVMLLGILPVGAMAASYDLYFDDYGVYDKDIYAIDLDTGYVYDTSSNSSSSIAKISCISSSGAINLSKLSDYFYSADYYTDVYFYSRSSRSSSYELSGTVYMEDYNNTIYCRVDLYRNASYSSSSYVGYYDITFTSEATDEYSMKVTLDRENYLDADDFYGSSNWKSAYDIKISQPRYGSIYDSSLKNDAEISYTGYYYLSDLENLYYYCSSSDAKKATYDYADFTIYNGNAVLITGTMYFNFGTSSSTTSGEKDFYLGVTSGKDTYFSASLFDDPGAYSYDLSKYTLSKLQFTMESVPVYGGIYNGTTSLKVGEVYTLDEISKLSYYVSSGSKTDSMTFSLYDTSSRTTLVSKATLYFVFDQDSAKSFTVNLSSGKSYNFTLSDFTSNFTAGTTNGSLKYVKILSVPSYGNLKLGSTTVRKNDVIEASRLSALVYEPISTVNKDAFTYAASSTGSLYSTEAAITLNGTYTPTDYTVSASGSVVTMTYNSVTPVSATASKTLSSDDVTYLVSKASTTGSTLLVYIPFTNSSLTGVGRSLTIDKSLFSGTNLSTFSRIILVDTTSTGNSIYLTVPTASVATLTSTYSGSFSMTLAPSDLTDENKQAAASIVGISRKVDFTINSAHVDPAGAELSIPYNTANDHYTSVIMVYNGYQSFSPILSSTWSDAMPYLSTDSRPYVTCAVESNKTYLSTINSTTYSDMASTHWAYNFIRYLSARGILSGYAGTDAGKIKPDSYVTRAQFIKMLVVALDLYNSNATTTYTDITGSASWASSYIGSAQTAGIVKDSGTSFRPNDNITREEMALYAYRAANAAGVTLSQTNAAVTFTDAAQISSTEMATAITAMQRAGIISGEAKNGVATGAFNPSGYTTRGAAAKIISMIMAPNVTIPQVSTTAVVG